MPITRKLLVRFWYSLHRSVSLIGAISLNAYRGIAPHEYVLTDGHHGAHSAHIG